MACECQYVSVCCLCCSVLGNALGEPIDVKNPEVGERKAGRSHESRARGPALFGESALPVAAVEALDLNCREVNSVEAPRIDVDLVGVGARYVKRSDSASRCGAPEAKWRITIKSTLSDSIFRTVSLSVSPLTVLDAVPWN